MTIASIQPPRDAVARAKKVTMLVTYTGKPGDRFDRGYYMARHIPMVEEAWSALGLESVDVLFAATDDQAIVATCVCRFGSADAMHAAMASPATAAVMSDVGRFTNIAPEQHVVVGVAHDA